MAREIWVQSQVESYQRLKKWYLMPPCLTLSIIRYGSRVKWSNPVKGVAPSPTPRCSKLLKREPSGHPRLKGDNFTFTLLLFNTNYSPEHYSFICTQLNGFKYCYVFLIIQLNISYLFTELNNQTIIFLKIQFSISHLFTHSLNVKQFYLTQT